MQSQSALIMTEGYNFNKTDDHFSVGKALNHKVRWTAVNKVGVERVEKVASFVSGPVNGGGLGCAWPRSRRDVAGCRGIGGENTMGVGSRGTTGHS